MQSIYITTLRVCAISQKRLLSYETSTIIIRYFRRQAQGAVNATATLNWIGCAAPHAPKRMRENLFYAVLNTLFIKFFGIL